jgi:SAM-dependent methyltransferase
MNRDQRVLQYVDKHMKIIEIGPSFNPLAPRSDGWNSKIIDHLSRENLIKKYPDQQIHRIEDVDFIWTSGPIETAVPAELYGTFDACIASHLVEHTPDFVGFFTSMSKLVRPDGLIVIAIPDRRFMFDFFQPLTLTDRILEAHWEKRTRHTKGTIFNNAAYNTQNNGMIAWSPRHALTEFSFIGPGVLESAKTASNAVTDESSGYIDCHVWRFTPASLKLVMLELSLLDLFPFTLVEMHEPSDTCEISFTLRNMPGAKPSASAVDPMRLDLFEQIRDESMKTAEAPTLRAQPIAGPQLSRKQRIVSGASLLISGIAGQRAASFLGRLGRSTGLLNRGAS